MMNADDGDNDDDNDDGNDDDNNDNDNGDNNHDDIPMRYRFRLLGPSPSYYSARHRRVVRSGLRPNDFGFSTPVLATTRPVTAE